ncbi:MAG: hypothetical protein Q9162_000259 [Coniocarpon cinnabarinum]
MGHTDVRSQKARLNSTLEESSASRSLRAGFSSVTTQGTFARGLKVRLSKRERVKRLGVPVRKVPSNSSAQPRIGKPPHGVATTEDSRRARLDWSPRKRLRPSQGRCEWLERPSAVTKAGPPRLDRFSWQSEGLDAPEKLRIKPRHIEIKPLELVTPSQPLTPAPTPQAQSPCLGHRPHPTSPNPVSRSRGDRPALPHFKFPDPGRKPLPPSPPWTLCDLAHARESAQRPSTPPRKERLLIVPDTPESLVSWDSAHFDRASDDMATNGIISPASSANIAGLAQQVNSSVQSGNSLSSLVCNVNRTTGDRPPPLVGASCTIVGDKMYVFAGRRLSRSKPNLTNTLFEIDLVNRHWRRLRTSGTKPAPRYFHSMNALGDTKLVCFGGMASGEDVTDASLSRTDSGMVLLNDLYMYDIATRNWTRLESPENPRGRYAHCAVILPSTTVATSEPRDTSSSGGHTPGSSQSGANGDGRGGAQLIVIGGQTPENKYVMEINVYNFRSRRWERADPLNKEYGAYRSVAIPLTSITPSEIGSAAPDGPTSPPPSSHKDDDDESHSTLIYSNYNFLDVKLEFCIRTQDGTLSERSMKGAFSPPGLRFPNGDVHADHFILSGTFLTSTRKEYALWALDLKTLTWQRIDVGPGILTSGSWNRGLLWKKRNMYVVFGDRRRKLDQDYNHRRLNFANMMAVELEAYGLYANPVTNLPSAKFVSASSPFVMPASSPLTDRPLHSEAGVNFGRQVLDQRELCDVDLLAIGGERIPVNSQVIARRWGPYLLHLLEGSSNPAASAPNGTANDATTNGANGRPLTIASQISRASSVTITPGSIGSSSTLGGGSTTSFTPAMNSAINNILPNDSSEHSAPSTTPSLDPSFGSSQILPASLRPRVLYLPHTAPTIRAFAHYLYTHALPPPGSELCSAQILCSLLQIARPYRVDGLLEAVVERIHETLDQRNTAAVFNAAAMAAGGGDAVAFTGALAPLSHRDRLSTRRVQETALAEGESDAEESEGGSVSSSTEVSGASESGDNEREESWTGELSSVVGLQKRGLRGLMEGRKMREQNEEGAAPSSGV